MNPAPEPPRRTIILLGASNLVRAFPKLPDLLRGGLGTPLDLVVAMGHGRAYGSWSRFAGRALPGILGCGLWQHLAERSGQTPPLAVIADLGNDLVYGILAETLLDGLETLLRRLRHRGSNSVLMSLPMASLARLTPLRFELARRLLFPGHPAEWSGLQNEIARLDAGMRALHQRYRTGWVETPPDWYGWDPIHIRRCRQAEAWTRAFGQWQPWRDGPVAAPALRWRERLTLRCLRPAERIWLGQRQLTPQPVRNADDYRLYLY